DLRRRLFDGFDRPQERQPLEVRPFDEEVLVPLLQGVVLALEHPKLGRLWGERIECLGKSRQLRLDVDDRLLDLPQLGLELRLGGCVLSRRGNPDVTLQRQLPCLEVGEQRLELGPAVFDLGICLRRLHQRRDLAAHRVELCQRRLDLTGQLSFDVERVQFDEPSTHLIDIRLGPRRRRARRHERQSPQARIGGDAEAGSGEELLVGFDRRQASVLQLGLDGFEELLPEHLQALDVAHEGDRRRCLEGGMYGVVAEVGRPHRGGDREQRYREDGAPAVTQDTKRFACHQMFAFSDSSSVMTSKPSHSWVARSRSPSRTPTRSCSDASWSSRATKSYMVTGPGEGGRVTLILGSRVRISSPWASDSESFSPGRVPTIWMAMSRSGTSPASRISRRARS